MNTKNGFVSSTVLWWVVGIVVVLALLVYFIAYAPGQNGTISTTSSSTPPETTPFNSTGGTAKPGAYTNLQYGYTVSYPSTTRGSIGDPGNISFSFAGANSTTTSGIVSINTNSNITLLSNCLKAPAGATQIATTTINGVAFLSFTAQHVTGAPSVVVHYKAVHSAPQIPSKVCFDIQKGYDGTATVNTKLDAIVHTFKFQ